MKIVHFLLGRCNPDSANGVEQTVYHLSRHQAQAGHEVWLFSLTNKPSLLVPGVQVRTFPPALLAFRLPPTLLRELTQTSPDWVHLHSAYVPANAALGLWLRRRGWRYAVTPNGNCSGKLLQRRPWLKQPYRFCFELPLLNGARFIHAVGDREEILRYGVSVPLVDAPNGIDPAALPTPQRPRLLRERFAAAANHRLLLFIGRLDWQQKGLDLLLEGLALTRDWALALVGPDWKGGRQFLESRVAALGLRERVLFWGPAYGQEKADLLTGADAFAHCSRWEGLAFSVVEALAARRICLLTSAADPCGLVARYRAGEIVAAEPQAIANGLVRLASLSDVDRARLIERAGELVRRELDWSRIAHTILEAYEHHAG